MAGDGGVSRRFIVGAALEFVGIIALAAALGADVGGSVLLVTGGAVLVVGAALQIWALVSSRRSKE